VEKKGQTHRWRGRARHTLGQTLDDIEFTRPAVGDQTLEMTAELVPDDRDMVPTALAHGLAEPFYGLRRLRHAEFGSNRRERVVDKTGKDHELAFRPIAAARRKLGAEACIDFRKPIEHGRDRFAIFWRPANEERANTGCEALAAAIWGDHHRRSARPGYSGDDGQRATGRPIVGETRGMRQIFHKAQRPKETAFHHALASMRS
jgi:hypothetical protein